MREALESFVIDNGDLERLEDLLSKFNIFEALGAVRVEVRHSAFLAYLLDPKQSHGLGEVFLRRFLQRVITGNNTVGLSPVDFDVWGLEDTVVYRERANIDILIENNRHRFVAIIENKIDSSEHSNQLERYLNWTKAQYSGYKIIPVFLDPEEREPSHDDYFSLGYAHVVEILEEILQRRGDDLSANTRFALDNYVQMLRRHILSDSELIGLAQRIYAKHKQALDFIFEQRPDRTSDITEHIKKLIAQQSELFDLDHSTKTAVRFAVRAWDSIEPLKSSKGWTSSGRILLFQFSNYADRTSLYFVIGPGDQKLRELVFEESGKHHDIFKNRPKNLTASYTTIFSRRILSRRDLEESDTTEIAEKITREWERFVSVDYPKFVKVIQQIDFNSLNP